MEPVWWEFGYWTEGVWDLHDKWKAVLDQQSGFYHLSLLELNLEHPVEQTSRGLWVWDDVMETESKQVRSGKYDLKSVKISILLSNPFISFIPQTMAMATFSIPLTCLTSVCSRALPLMGRSWDFLSLLLFLPPCRNLHGEGCLWGKPSYRCRCGLWDAWCCSVDPILVVQPCGVQAESAHLPGVCAVP